jgi:large subunit ribosomal protein L13
MTVSNQTYLAKPGEVLQDWQHFDADGAVLGRMAARIAMVLQGKHHARYTPHVDTGDFVIVTNATKVYLSGDKRDGRIHRHHTGWMGGLKEMSTGEMLEKHPTRVIELAVRRMMPKTRLGRAMLTKLKIYAGSEHRHAAQQPSSVDMTPFKPRR